MCQYANESMNLIGTLAHWHIGTLAHWHIAILSPYLLVNRTSDNTALG